MKIDSVSLRPSITSRNDPTIEATVRVKGGYEAVATAPAGASTGEFEALHLPKGGTQAAIDAFRVEKLIGADASDLKLVSDLLKEIDGTNNFSSIGAATAFAVSVASAAAEAKARSIPLFKLLDGSAKLLPFPLGNVLGGGKHAGNGSPDIQEFLVSSVGAGDPWMAINGNINVHRQVRKLLEKRDPQFAGGKGDEGAWAPNLKDEEALEIVRNAVDATSKELGFKIIMGVDMASSTFYSNGIYDYSRKGKKLNTEEQLAYVEKIAKTYDLQYVEDPFDEQDFESFADLTKGLSNVLVVGDDIFVTNVSRLKKGIDKRAANAVILKVNQVGTLYDALEFSRLAREGHMGVVTSHRSGDTPEGYLAHIAVGSSSILMKSGVAGGERTAKLMELDKIAKFDKGLKMVKVVV